MSDRIECDFSKARVGDKAWDMFYGDVTIHSVDSANVFATDSRDYEIRRGLDGKINFEDYLPSLYWSRPVFTVPPPPKRKKKVTVWVGIGPKCTHGRYGVSGYAYESRDLGGWKYGVHPIEIEVDDE